MMLQSTCFGTWIETGVDVCVCVCVCVCVRARFADRWLSVITENFVRDLILNILYFWLQVRNFSSMRKPCTHTSVSDIALAVQNYSVWKFANARVRNFYAYENFCDYSIWSHNRNTNANKKCFSWSLQLTWMRLYNRAPWHLQRTCSTGLR